VEKHALKYDPGKMVLEIMALLLMIVFLVTVLGRMLQPPCPARAAAAPGAPSPHGMWGSGMLAELQDEGDAAGGAGCSCISRGAVFDAETGVIDEEWGAAGDAPSLPPPPPPRFARSLAQELGLSCGGLEVGMGSEASDVAFQSFWLRCAEGAVDAAPRVTGGVVRRAFGGTIHPSASVRVEPLRRGGGVWWDEVLHDCAGSRAEAGVLGCWDGIIEWFAARTRDGRLLGEPVFVRVGGCDGQEKDGHPEFCMLPCMAVALSPDGCLVGLFGWVVQT